MLGSICSYMTVCISRVWTKCSQLLLEQENVKKRMRMPIEPVLLEAQVRAADRDNDTWWELTFVNMDFAQVQSLLKSVPHVTCVEEKNKITA